MNQQEGTFWILDAFHKACPTSPPSATSARLAGTSSPAPSVIVCPRATELEVTPSYLLSPETSSPSRRGPRDLGSCIHFVPGDQQGAMAPPLSQHLAGALLLPPATTPRSSGHSLALGLPRAGPLCPDGSSTVSRATSVLARGSQ